MSGFLDPDPNFHHRQLFLIDDPRIMEQSAMYLTLAFAIRSKSQLLHHHHHHDCRCLIHLSSCSTLTRPTPESILGRTLRSKYSPTVGTATSDFHCYDDGDDDDDDYCDETVIVVIIVKQNTHMSWA